jgi:hypothetical protein
MRKHFTRILTTLLAIVMLLPVTAQAAPADSWTDEAEQAYQTVTELVIQRVSESKDYLATATQEENAKVVYALWTSGAAVPSGFYDEYLQALADWLDLAVKRGKTAYIPGVIRTVAAMGLDVTDFAGHNLVDALRKPELVEADEDRLDMLMDLDAVGDAGKTDEFNALRETLLTEALARQQSSGEFRYTSKWPAELKQKGVDDEPDRFDYILLTAKSVQALAPYMSRKNVATAIDKALNYLSEQQLSSGGFVKYGDEDVEEDAAVLEMLATLGISLTDERFTKDGHTVLDGMMGWYQDFYFEGAKTSEPKQGFYREDIVWNYREPRGWYGSMVIQMNDPTGNGENGEKAVPNRIYDNAEPYMGLCAVQRIAGNDAKIDNPPVNSGAKTSSIDYKALLQEQADISYGKVKNGWFWDENVTIVSESAISHYAKEVLSLEQAQGELTKAQKEELQTIMQHLTDTNSEYLMGLKSATYSPGAVRAMKSLDMDPANANGLDFLAPLTDVSSKGTGMLADALKDLDSIDLFVWRSRGVNADSVVDKYAAKMLQNQMADGKFSYDADNPIWEEVQFTAENVAALAPHTDKEYIAKAIDKAVEYLSSVQLADGSFPGRDGQPDGEATLAVLDMMNAAGISLDDVRFVKNGNTVADGLRTFYIEGVGFVSKTEVEASVDGLSEIPSYDNPVMDFSSAVSALTYLQAAENGKFGPDGKGNSVFEIVGSALTKTPLGAILLAVIIVALLAFGMIRRYRRIKKEQ